MILQNLSELFSPPAEEAAAATAPNVTKYIYMKYNIK